MKTNITFRSTLSNTSWIQRSAGALLMAALIVTFTLVLRPSIEPPASAPAAHQAAPARNPHVPIIGAGSAYDGSAYVEYLTGRSAASNPNVPVVGAGSAYDGGAYGPERPATRNPNVPVVGAGSAYDGQ